MRQQLSCYWGCHPAQGLHQLEKAVGSGHSNSLSHVLPETGNIAACSTYLGQAELRITQARTAFSDQDRTTGDGGNSCARLVATAADFPFGLVSSPLCFHGFAAWIAPGQAAAPAR